MNHIFLCTPAEIKENTKKFCLVSLLKTTCFYVLRKKNIIICFFCSKLYQHIILMYVHAPMTDISHLCNKGTRNDQKWKSTFMQQIFH